MLRTIESSAAFICFMRRRFLEGRVGVGSGVDAPTRMSRSWIEWVAICVVTGRDLVMADAPRVCGGDMSGPAARSMCAARAGRMPYRLG